MTIAVFFAGLVLGLVAGGWVMWRIGVTAARLAVREKLRQMDAAGAVDHTKAWEAFRAVDKGRFEQALRDRKAGRRPKDHGVINHGIEEPRHG